MELVEKFLSTPGGITIKDQFLPAKKMFTSSRKIILSNVQPFLPDAVILENLSKHNIKPTSPIMNMHIRLEDHENDMHIMNFRRFVYIVDDKNIKLPEMIPITYDNEFNRIFITPDELRCFLCKQVGHISTECEANKMDSTGPEQNLQFKENPADLFQVEKDETVIPSTPENLVQNSNKRGAPSTISDSSGQSEVIILPIPELINSDIKVPPSSPKKDGKPPKNKSKKKQDTKPLSIRQLMEPIQNNLNTKFKEGVYPIDSGNFSLLLDMVNGIGNPLPIVQEFTKDISGIIQMLSDNYSTLQHRSMKIRFTKLKKRLLNDDIQSSDEEYLTTVSATS